MRDRVAQKATRQMGRMVVEDPSTLLAQAPGAPPDTSDLEAVSRSSTLLLLHPLCLRAGRVGVALDWLARNELLVFDAEPLRMREEQIRLV